MVLPMLEEKQQYEPEPQYTPFNSQTSNGIRRDRFFKHDCFTIMPFGENSLPNDEINLVNITPEARATHRQEYKVHYGSQVPVSGTLSLTDRIQEFNNMEDELLIKKFTGQLTRFDELRLHEVQNEKDKLLGLDKPDPKDIVILEMFSDLVKQSHETISKLEKLINNGRD